MSIVVLILLILAYTIGVMTIFLEIICYRKKMEDIESILFTLAFFFLIILLSISYFSKYWGTIENNSMIDYLSQMTLIALGLMTPLSIFAERQLTLSKKLKMALFIIAASLLLLLVSKFIFNLNLAVHIPINIFLMVSVFASMIMIRRSKPGIKIKHRERIERITAITVLTLLPLFLFLEYYFQTNVPITMIVFFIILASSKFLDDLNRLSLLKDQNELKPSQSKNFGLTQREQEVAALLVKGSTYAKIGEELFISMPTVKSHVSNIYRKVGVKNKMELFYALSE